MQLITPPHRYNDDWYAPTPPCIFVAGGISGTSDWQSEFCTAFSYSNAILFNPRRNDFDTSNRQMEEEQIEWEFFHLHYADIISFWFTPETLCPITLFELGTCVVNPSKRVFVGCHPDYKRIRDIKIQLRLREPSIEVVNSLEELIEQIKSYIKDGL